MRGKYEHPTRHRTEFCRGFFMKYQRKYRSYVTFFGRSLFILSSPCSVRWHVHRMFSLLSPMTCSSGVLPSTSNTPAQSNVLFIGRSLFNLPSPCSVRCLVHRMFSLQPPFSLLILMSSSLDVLSSTSLLPAQSECHPTVH